MRVAKTGGTAVVLHQLEWGPDSIVVDPLHVYWLMPVTHRGAPGGYGEILRAPVGGGTVESVAGSQDCPSTIALDEHHVYWSDSVTRQILRMAKPGHPTQ